MVAEGWRSIRVDRAPGTWPHLIMRYRNQLGLVFVAAEWAGRALTEWSPEVAANLLERASRMRALPLLATLRLAGALPEGAAPRSALGLEMSLPDGVLLRDLSLDAPWEPRRYDLEEPIEISDWELHDLGIQIVRDRLIRDNHQILGWTSDLDVDPQIAVKMNNRLMFLMIRSVRHPESDARFDRDAIADLADMAARKQAEVRLVSVSIASGDPPLLERGLAPICRGRAVSARIGGLMGTELRRRWMN